MESQRKEHLPNTVGAFCMDERKYAMPSPRPDKQGAHRTAFDKNKKRILMTQDVCGICGKLVDKKLKYPDPMSPVIDHIIPINKGGHPSAIENLQLAHWSCNRQKSDKLFNTKQEPKVIGNRNLPQSMDWTKYKS